MTEINKVLRRATGRLLLERVLRGLVLGLLVASCAVVAARLGERFLAYTLDWEIAWALAGAAGVLFALVWAFLTRQNRLAVARVVDERAGLKEAISTALCVESSGDAWSRAALDHAQEVSRRVVIRDVVPVRAPRGWFAPLVAVGVFFALGLVPQSDLLGLSAERKQEEERQQEVLRAEVQSQEAQEILAKVDSLLDVGDGAGAEEPAEPEVAQLTDPMEIRRDAMAKLTSAQERLDKLQNGQESQTLDAMKGLMEQLKQPGPGPLDQMSKALQQGDFEQARQQLGELAEKIAQGEMDEQQQAQLQKQLKSLAEQLDQLAQQRNELEKKLEELGLDKELAKSPDQLRQALESAPHLNEQQKQMLQELAKSQSQTQSMCQNMASACAGAAGSGLSPEDLNLDQLSQLADQFAKLSDLEKQQAMAALQQAEIQAKLAELSECMGQCEGGGLSDKMGNKYSLNTPRNQRGRGGGDSEEAPTDFSTKKEKVIGEDTGDDVILGSQFVQGEQVRGESRAKFAEAVRAASESASEEIESNQIPREFHEAIKKYFGALEETAKDAPAPPASGDRD